jgi:hypothetical protein
MTINPEAGNRAWEQTDIGKVNDTSNWVHVSPMIADARDVGKAGVRTDGGLSA